MKIYIKDLNTLSLFPNKISLHIVFQNLKKKNVRKNINYISNFKLPRVVNLDSTAMFPNNDVTLSIELLNGKANAIIENEIRQLVNKFIGSSKK